MPVLKALASRLMIGVGMTYPMLSAEGRFWNAKPHALPSRIACGLKMRTVGS